MNKAFPSLWMNTVLIAVLVLVALLPGCTPQPPTQPLTSEQALQHNLNGVRAALDSNFDYARQQFDLSNQLYAAIEDNKGRLLPLLNLSRLERRLGMIEDATRHIDLALGLAGAAPVEGLAFEKALILLRQGELSQAANWAEKALAWSAVDQRARSLNLLGRIALEAGQLSKAQDFVGAALTKTQPLSATEQANGLRLQGQIFLQQKNLPQAENVFEQALQIDKQLELGTRMATDLEGLASVSLQRRDKALAVSFLHRALKLHIYNHDERGGCEVFTRLKPLCQAPDSCGDLFLDLQKRLQCD